MSDTPETDDLARGNHVVPTEWAEQLEIERNEAIRQRDETNESSVFTCNFYYEEKLKAERERDEAREAVPAGEWVAYEDHKKVHDAASRLLAAINKELPIGCFTLVSSEYYMLQNAIYGKEATK